MYPVSSWRRFAALAGGLVLAAAVLAAAFFFWPRSSGQTTAAPPPAAAPAAAANAVPCRDGEQMAVTANALSRTPLGVGNRWSINEISWVGTGFGGLQRAIIILSPLGDSHAVHLVNGMTARTVAFCGDGPSVSTWAVKAHVGSLQQASQAPNGSRPNEAEIPVYWVDFAGDGKVHVVKDGPQGPSPNDILAHLQVSKDK